MEEQYTEPVEQTTVPNETVEQQPTETVDTPDVSRQADQEVSETKSNNWNNGKRRIQRRQSLKARIRELEKENAELRDKDDDYSKFRSQQLQDRIDDLSAMDADAEASDLADHAAQFFGDETPQFMQKVYTYAGYVNQNEPSLLKYVQRDYGPILLHEWMQRMDEPALRQQWLEMTPYEKDRVLDRFYSQIIRIINSQTGTPQATPKSKSVPVPNGGRESPSNEPTDDFGIELSKAFARHKG